MKKHWQRTREVVLLVLAIATVPLLILPTVLDLTSAQESAIFAADIAILAVFALDFFGGLALADNRRRYLRTHWIDALIVLLPFLRPLRAARAFESRPVWGAGT